MYCVGLYCINTATLFHLSTSDVTYRANMASPPVLNPLAPNDHYSGRTAPLTSEV